MSKFRVWDKNEQKMYYDGFYITPDGRVVWPNDAKPDPDSYILMEHTGKKDKDGVKAYEGDEVKEDYTGIVYEIGWDSHNAGFSLRRKDGEGIKRDDGYEYCGWLYGLSGAFKIIGNIHEHRNSLDNEQ